MTENDVILSSTLLQLSNEKRRKFHNGLRFLGYRIPNWLLDHYYIKVFLPGVYIGVADGGLVRIRSPIDQNLKVWGIEDIDRFIMLTDMEP